MLIATKSTPVKPDSIILLIAFPPAPPTPTTLMLALMSGSKSNCSFTPPELGAAFFLRVAFFAPLPFFFRRFLLRRRRGPLLFRGPVLWSDRFRMLAVVLGVSVPMVVAYLLWRASAEREIEATEIIEAVEKYVLDEKVDALPRLPSSSANTSKPSDVQPDRA